MPIEKLKKFNERMRALIEEFLFGKFLFEKHLWKERLKEERQVMRQVHGSGGVIRHEAKPEMQSASEPLSLIDSIESMMQKYATTIQTVAANIQTAAGNAMNNAIQNAYHAGQLSQSQSVAAQKIAHTTQTQVFTPQNVTTAIHSSAPTDPEEELEKFVERAWNKLFEMTHGFIKQGIASLEHSNNDQRAIDQRAISKVLEPVFQKGLTHCQNHHPVIHAQLVVGCKAHRELATHCRAHGILPHASDAQTATPPQPRHN